MVVRLLLNYMHVYDFWSRVKMSPTSFAYVSGLRRLGDNVDMHKKYVHEVLQEIVMRVSSWIFVPTFGASIEV